MVSVACSQRLPGLGRELHLGVDHSTGLFDPQAHGSALPACPVDREIPKEQGLGAPERVGRNIDGPQAVPLLSNPIIHRRMPPQTLNRMQPG